MTKNIKIPDLDEAWDTREIGSDEKYAAIVQDDIESDLDESLDLKLVSIRLQKSLIEDFKVIAKLNGIGYQPLMRQILTRFAESEKRQILNQVISEVVKSKEDDNKKRKVA